MFQRDVAFDDRDLAEQAATEGAATERAVIITCSLSGDDDLEDDSKSTMSCEAISLPDFAWLNVELRKPVARKDTKALSKRVEHATSIMSHEQLQNVLKPLHLRNFKTC